MVRKSKTAQEKRLKTPRGGRKGEPMAAAVLTAEQREDAIRQLKQGTAPAEVMRTFGLNYQHLAAWKRHRLIPKGIKIPFKPELAKVTVRREFSLDDFLGSIQQFRQQHDLIRGALSTRIREKEAELQDLRDQLGLVDKLFTQTQHPRKVEAA